MYWGAGMWLSFYFKSAGQYLKPSGAESSHTDLHRKNKKSYVDVVLDQLSLGLCHSAKWQWFTFRLNKKEISGKHRNELRLPRADTVSKFLPEFCWGQCHALDHRMWSSVRCRHVAGVVSLLPMVSSDRKVMEREVCLSWLCLFYFWPASQGSTIMFLSLGKGRQCMLMMIPKIVVCLLSELLVNSI